MNMSLSVTHPLNESPFISIALPNPSELVMLTVFPLVASGVVLRGAEHREGVGSGALIVLTDGALRCVSPPNEKPAQFCR